MDKIKFVPAWDNGASALGAHWIREGAPATRNNTLDSLMETDHVIHVDADGAVTPHVSGVWAPESEIVLDENSQLTDAAERDYIAAVKRSGWDVVCGYSINGSGPLMHASQFVGGPLAEHMMETPGHWVCVTPSVVVLGHCDGDDACEECAEIEGRGLDGWIILHREA